MKKTKKLIPAVAMLMISAILLATASYAWFTMSREVTANGMNVQVTAPTNLLISNDTAPTEFGATATDTNADTVKINPSSSIDGTNFFALKNGSTVNATSGARDADSVFETASGSSYYKDFVYHVKTEGDDTVSVAIKSFEVTKNANSTTGNDNSILPVRAAVIVNGVTANNIVSANATVAKAIKSVQEDPAGTVKDTDLDTVKTATLKTTANTGTEVFTVAKGTTVDVTVRVWYEGEDSACTVANGANFNFDVKLVLADKTVA